jgi:hypothetical protein
LKLQYDRLLSSFAFKFNLRRHNLADVKLALAAKLRCQFLKPPSTEAGADTRPLSSST